MEGKITPEQRAHQPLAVGVVEVQEMSGVVEDEPLMAD
jgi:hypothetical protein